ncbi:MAG: ATP-dependent DNA helicase RecG [Firmicutes bacterium]|nr:ATP-dependent DNA helicase RecG [Bacillota bacterium]
MSDLLKSVKYLKGVGPKRAKKLRKIEISTVEDLLYYFPRTYDDRRHVTKINKCIDGERVNLNVEVCGVGTNLRTKKRLSISKLPVKDDTGYANLVWFNQSYVLNNFEIGDEIKVNGKVNRKYGKIEISNPTYEKKENRNNIGSIIPVYPLTESLSQTELLKIISNAIKGYNNKIEEILPKDLIKALDLYTLKKALMYIHFPKDKITYKKAKERLIFDELLILQLGLILIKKNINHQKKGIKFKKVKEIKDFINDLPFKLTKAQKRVFNEISSDMESEKSMNRLLQGDVGSGKTVVALLAILKAIKSGFQCAMMAPTEILAIQHYQEITKLLDKYDIKCRLLVGGLTKTERNKILKDIKEGKIDLIIGTHAVIQKDIEFNKLGLAITDEQHRFGVRQRAALTKKGYNPDIIVMTATPIPRSLALILYGDLDISVIDELPPGRKKVDTYAVDKTYRERIYNFIKKQLNMGRQAYIVCPLVEESEDLDLLSATDLYENLKKSYFNDYNLGLLHGKMKSKEKEKIMVDFKNKEIDILVSTTVIEVGVNVTNANTMLIENAERFGLAQLHQLRGRVGRGNYKSYCILINEGKTDTAKERMAIMEKTNDGFKVSKKDLDIRGPGEFFGTKQHGLFELKIADITKDMNKVKEIREIAMKILKEEPRLNNKYKKLKEKIICKFKDNIKDISLN